MNKFLIINIHSCIHLSMLVFDETKKQIDYVSLELFIQYFNVPPFDVKKVTYLAEVLYVASRSNFFSIHIERA